MMRLPGGPLSGVPIGASRHRRPSMTTMRGAPEASSEASPEAGPAAPMTGNASVGPRSASAPATAAAEEAGARRA